MSASGVISNLSQALNCAGKCDCCAQLQAQINALEQRINNIKSADEESIIQRALSAADSKWGLTLGIPVAFGAIIKINGLKSELDVVKSIGQEALQTSLTARNTAATAQSYAKNAETIATKAQGSAASALAQVVALAASVGALLIAIGTIAALGSRIDQVERGVAMLSDDVSKIIGQLGVAKAEARSALQKVESAIIRAEAAFGLAMSADGRANIADSTANRAIGEARGAIEYAKNVAATAKDAIAKANDAIVKGNQAINQANQALSRVTIVEPKVQQAQTTAEKAQGTAQQAESTADKAQGTAQQAQTTADRAQGTAQQAQSTADKAQGTAKEALSGVVELKDGYVELRNQTSILRVDVNLLKKDVGGLQGDVLGLQYTIPVLTGGIQNVAAKVATVDRELSELEIEVKTKFGDRIIRFDQGQLDKINQQIKQGQTDVKKATQEEIDKAVKRVEEELKKTSQKVDSPQFNRDVEKLKTDIGGLDRRLREQEKVNEDGAKKIDQLIPTIGGIDRKLEQIIPTLGGIPLIPGRVAEGIKPFIPTVPQIKKATKDGVCEEFQGNGCAVNALNNNANNISNNINRSIGGKLDGLAQGFNTGANAVQLALLNTINTKLGAQVQGGISGALSRFTSWLQLDRLLNILTFAATVHNALMLSNDLGQTLMGAINNVLQLIGLKDEKGENIDISKIISSSIENIIKGAIGAENYQQLNTAWSKANRIYQASVNILNNFQGLASTILTALEMTAGKVAKIGNALRSAGEVLDNAYNWMNPQPKYNRITQTLESLQNGASTIQMVTQAPLDIIQATTELTNSATELTNAIKDDTQDSNKGKEAPEPDKLKADKDASKTASAGKEITSADLDPDD